MLSKIREIFWRRSTRPAFRSDEGIVLEGAVAFQRGLIGSRSGRLIVTNQRVLWYERGATSWPFKPISGEVTLTDIASVDKGTLFDFIGGGRRLRLRLRSGKDKCFFEGEGKLNKWIATIRQLIADDQ